MTHCIFGQLCVPFFFFGGQRQMCIHKNEGERTLQSECLRPTRKPVTIVIWPCPSSLLTVIGHFQGSSLVIWASSSSLLAVPGHFQGSAHGDGVQLFAAAAAATRLMRSSILSDSSVLQDYNCCFFIRSGKGDRFSFQGSVDLVLLSGPN